MDSPRSLVHSEVATVWLDVVGLAAAVAGFAAVFVVGASRSARIRAFTSLFAR